MTAARVGAAHGHGEEAALASFDCVYFLMFPGWRNELRSNRWHFASRFARHVPVVMLQPTQHTRALEATSEPEGRIAGVRLLHIRASSWPVAPFRDAQHQAGQILQDMRAQGLNRPLLWSYNPRLFALNAMLPAVARVHHATENYFDFSGLDRQFVDALRATIRISDVVVAVSEGVSEGISEADPSAVVRVVTNGCDYQSYSSYRPDAELVRAASGFRRTAIFAGNINSRLDFELLERVTQSEPDTLFAIVGPVSGLSADEEQDWRALERRSNVNHLGAVSPDRLPDLYGAADVGFIPYKHEPWLIKNGFPLKALEMATTGLPVVSTLLEPLVGLTSGLRVTSSGDEFLTTFKTLGRATLTDSERIEMEKVCRANDYDAKFAHVCTLLGEAADGSTPPTTRVDAAVSSDPNAWRNEWIENMRSSFGPWEALGRHVFGAAYSRVGNTLPSSMRRRIPKQAKQLLKRALPPS